MTNLPRPWVHRAETAASQKKRVLAVEGKTDKAALSAWLGTELGPTWANDVYLEVTDNRGSMLDGLRWLRDNRSPFEKAVFGLADRDEWELAEISALQTQLPQVLVNLDRHALESYFCDPDELEPILRGQDAKTGRNEYTPLLSGLRQQMTSALAEYVPHWAICRVIQRANERIRNDAEYPRFFQNRCPLPSDVDIQTKLAEWSGVLDSDVLFADFIGLRSSSFQRPLAEQFRGCVESKLFLGTTVVNGPHGLNRVKTQSKEDWLVELARWSPAMPTDLRATLAPALP